VGNGEGVNPNKGVDGFILRRKGGFVTYESAKKKQT